ncbi:hypothetical protein FG386_000816 [Cryptosporidium ryanae]|uniref:uncharacterized protein n=1 Tax=Cryptosporidium ryanae TaxID=515981 RepID=UPI003519D863|nr:hypothetical protein FG386_000816 [Cryptosporidium ryanae]
MSSFIRKLFTGITGVSDSTQPSHGYNGTLYKSIGKTLNLVLFSCKLSIEDGIKIVGFNPNDNQKEEYIFNFQNIYYFNCNRQGELTIILRSGSDLVKFVFEFEKQNLHILSSICYNITISLKSLCSIVDQIPVEFYEHNDTNSKGSFNSSHAFNPGEWSLISKNCMCQLLSSKDYKDIIFSIKDLSECGNILFTSIIGDNILFLPKLTERVVEFYGSNDDDIRKRYRIHLKINKEINEDNDSYSPTEDEVDAFLGKLLECIDQINPEEKRRKKSISDFNNDEISDNGITYKMDMDDRYNPLEDQIMWYEAENEDRSDDSSDNDYEYKKTTVRRNKSIHSSLSHRYLLIGHENTFVGRADRKTNKSEIAVFKNIEYEESNYTLSGTPARNISVMKNVEYNNQNILPVSGQLHNCETQMLFLSETDPNYVYQMDLENEKILRRWDADGLPISCLGLSNKDSQYTPVPTFLGLSNNALFVMDSRIKDNSNRFTSKLYRSNVLFSSLATDKDGHILLGNDLGELRLYDGTINKDGEFKKAKTLLNSFSSPILSVDVTRNGNWILATTKNCIHLYPVCEQNQDFETVRNGFVTSLKNKPPSRKLRLKPDDIYHYNITDVNFTPARFDQSQDSSGNFAETKIISSVDNLVIVWDFEAIKRGNLYAYSIKEVEYKVEDCSTFYNSSDSVVLAYNDDLTIHKLGRKNKRNIYSRT